MLELLRRTCCDRSAGMLIKINRGIVVIGGLEGVPNILIQCGFEFDAAVFKRAGWNFKESFGEFGCYSWRKNYWGQMGIYLMLITAML